MKIIKVTYIRKDGIERVRLFETYYDYINFYTATSATIIKKEYVEKEKEV